MHKDKDSKEHDNESGRAQRGDTSDHDLASPAHWQGEPVPYGENKKTQDIGFDQRGAGRARQYGQAGVHGQHHNEQERRPQRGQMLPDKDVLDAVHDVFRQSGVDLGGVTVTVSQGLVELNGNVAHRDEKDALERLAANCRGTITVRNQLEVVSRPADDAAV